jgi:hypothetical protein
MTEDNKRRQYWDYLTTERNQPRQKGITVQRLAVIKPRMLTRGDIWSEVIEKTGAGTRPAAEFYQSGEESSVRSRAAFWNAVRSFIVRDEGRGRPNISDATIPQRSARHRKQCSVISGKNRKRG